MFKCFFISFPQAFRLYVHWSLESVSSGLCFSYIILISKHTCLLRQLTNLLQILSQAHVGLFNTWLLFIVKLCWADHRVSGRECMINSFKKISILQSSAKMAGNIMLAQSLMGSQNSSVYPFSLLMLVSSCGRVVAHIGHASWGW